jgi:hypothetical protein
MSFTGSEGAPIALTTAADWTAAYRSANPGTTIAHFFGDKIIQDILAQEGCVGIRMYYGIDTDGASQLILVGADSEEKDLVEGIVADYSCPCPNMCGSSNALNS